MTSPAASHPTSPRGEGVLSIGEVLGLLRPEFPDVTISKLRFLEAEGHPAQLIAVPTAQ